MPDGHRRLAAIMFTDIVGYTSLTQRDESLALKLLEEHRRIVRQRFSSHNSKEVKTIGDAFLAEFPSALQAVRCAYEIQQSLADRNQQSEQARRIMIRVGDVVYGDEGKDVYGNCVDIASTHRIAFARISREDDPESLPSRPVHRSLRAAIQQPHARMG